MSATASLKRTLSDCKCGGLVGKVVYSGEYGVIECSKCEHVVKGFMMFSELMDKWNVENTDYEIGVL